MAKIKGQILVLYMANLMPSPFTYGHPSTPRDSTKSGVDSDHKLISPYCHPSPIQIKKDDYEELEAIRSARTKNSN